MRAAKVSENETDYLGERRGAFLKALANSINAVLVRTGGQHFRVMGPYPSYTKAEVVALDAANYPRSIVYVSNGDGDRYFAGSNGTGWFYMDGTPVT